MKRMICFLLVLVLGFSLPGCVMAQVSDPTVHSAPAKQTEDSITVETVDPQHRPVLRPTKPAEPGETLPLGGCGGTRIGYSAVISAVRYITESSQLPDHDALAHYDDAYFETGALVLVTETVGSASAHVSIASVTILDGVASVRLSHDMPDGAHAPAMTTWLVWAEVEQGLDCDWTLENPAMDSEAESY